MALADPSEVRVSAVTKSLAEGGGLEFRDAGTHQLKGFASPAATYTVESGPVEAGGRSREARV